MSGLTLEAARAIIAATRAKGREMGLKPLAVVVLDAGGNITAFEREDGASNLRFNMAYAKAYAKAYGAIGIGLGSRALMQRAETQPYFTNSVGLVGGFENPR